jgi:cold-inducible RNA-binding protein
MAKNLYVGNLAPTVKEADLERLFTQAGAVTSVNVIKDRYTGQSRGFGFVEMSNNQHAQDAIKQFDGFVLEGQKIQVNEARPRRDDRDSGRGHDAGGSGRSRW